jgi:hypothetical protein
MRFIAQGFGITLLPSFLLSPGLAMADPSLASPEFSTSASEAVAASATAVGGLALAAGTFTVSAITVLGTTTRIVLTDVVSMTSTTLEFTGGVLRAGALAVGRTLQVVAYLTGFAVIGAGELIAFVANDTGRALVHSSQIEFN